MNIDEKNIKTKFSEGSTKTWLDNEYFQPKWNVKIIANCSMFALDRRKSMKKFQRSSIYWHCSTAMKEKVQNK